MTLLRAVSVLDVEYEEVEKEAEENRGISDLSKNQLFFAFNNASFR